MANEPVYTTVDSVKVRLAGKVQFQAGSVPVDGEFPNDLLCQLIVDAETDVEQELRNRYAVPFRSIRTGRFIDMPNHSIRAVRSLVDARAVILVLSTDFGRGTHIDGSEYYKAMEAQYEEKLDKMLGRVRESSHGLAAGSSQIVRYRFAPPIEDMLLAPTNSKADDGYRGMIINTDQHRDSATYAAEQVNDPSKNYLDTFGLRLRRGN